MSGRSAKNVQRNFIGACFSRKIAFTRDVARIFGTFIGFDEF